ncbi:MAG: MFS transporter [Acutalibacteraceae bacterium]|nr:MFS transporter [Acutalibacteraceae bacterium]
MGERFKKAIGVEGKFVDTVWPMIQYCFANIYLGGGGYIISMYFTVFLTNVVGMDLQHATFIIMLATIWDGINDPLMGIITDRTRSKYGRHRRYLLWSIPILIVAYSMLWNSFGLDAKEHPTVCVMYYAFAYILYKTAYTMIEVPHTAMLPTLAPEYNKRTQYTSVSYIFNSVGMIPSYIILLIFLSVFGSSGTLSKESQMPFMLTGVVLSIVYAVSVFATFKTVKEPSSLNDQPPKLDLRFAIDEYIQVFRSKAFRDYFSMSFFWQMARSFYSTSSIYFITYLANLYKYYPIYNTFAGVFESLAFPLNYALTMKKGKSKCGAVVTPFMIIGLGLLLFVKTGSPEGNSSIIPLVLMILGGAVLYPFGMSGLGFVGNNVMPDLTDVDELITGRRREGVISTCNTMVKQVVGGVMTFLVGTVLKYFGLVTGNEGVYIQQNDTAILGIRFCVSVLPMISAVVAYILLKRFKMTKDDHTMIRAAIATKHKYGTVTLTDYERQRCELLSGYKLEEIWIGKDNDETEIHTLDKNANGEYLILLELDEIKKKQLKEAE